MQNKMRKNGGLKWNSYRNTEQYFYHFYHKPAPDSRLENLFQSISSGGERRYETAITNAGTEFRNQETENRKQ